MPSSVLSFCETYGATSLFGNIEYEVDELRRDIEICMLAVSKGIQTNLFHDRAWRDCHKTAETLRGQ